MSAFNVEITVQLVVVLCASCQLVDRSVLKTIRGRVGLGSGDISLAVALGD